MYDCIVIGTGAAGVSAALALKSLGMSFLLIGNPSLSAKIRRAEVIKNYPGLPSVTGEKLSSAFLSQLKEEGIAVTEGNATGVYGRGGNFTVTCQSEVYQSRTVILAGGVEAVKPVEGERRLLGKGVSYCAACDGFLYRGKVIAVFAAYEEEEADIELLSRFAGKIYLFRNYAGGRAMPANVELCGGRIKQICGGERVEKIVTDGGEIAVDGVFMLKGATAGDCLIKGLETQNGSIKVDRSCSTNIEGVFAAGDCTGRPYQYVKAAGEGNVAAHSAHGYTVSLKKAQK